MNKQPIVWVFGDHLSPTQPALRQYPNAPALYVWDTAMLARNQLSLKRIAFVYECLLELPVEIQRGHPVDVLSAFAQAHNTNTIVTVDSVSPRFQQHCQRLSEKGFAVERLTPEPFVKIDQDRDLKRASRYWRQIQAVAFTKTESS